MKITIICVGRLKEDAERKIFGRYLERLSQIGGQYGLGTAVLIELPEGRAKTARERKAGEAETIRKRIPAVSKIFMLDERGRSLSSAEFSGTLRAARDGGFKNLCLIIGGPDGLDQDLVNQADMAISFGRMTMPHGLVRAVLAEQLYRAATILAGHPYHRE
jgi:23S rRNA (pseudouridine1915-N3)-methyltransferase